MSTVEKKKLSAHAIALRHEMSRNTIVNRLKEKRIRNEFVMKRQLLISQKETAIFIFVDQFTTLRFSFRLYMIEEKVLLLFQKRDVSKSKLKMH
jgi:hypothetical protein